MDNKDDIIKRIETEFPIAKNIEELTGDAKVDATVRISALVNVLVEKGYWKTLSTEALSAYIDYCNDFEAELQVLELDLKLDSKLDSKPISDSWN